MLKDNALDYYFANQIKQGIEIRSIEAVYESIKLNFEGKEHKINLL